jgi:hypothetical protein
MTFMRAVLMKKIERKIKPSKEVLLKISIKNLRKSTTLTMRVLMKSSILKEMKMRMLMRKDKKENLSPCTTGELNSTGLARSSEESLDTMITRSWPL